MAACAKTRDFFLNGDSRLFDRVLDFYDKALRLKAESKSSRPENVIRLDKWYQNELPKKIKSRGKDQHLTHEELVQTIKWKLARGKFRPNLTNLVQMNTPRIVVQETKKGFRNAFKRGDLQAAMVALCNLKGVGPAMASAVLAAGAPHLAPFMADECLLAMPDCDSLDYTIKEYMRYVEEINKCVERLNEQGEGESWTPHKVELAVWTFYIINDLQPEMLVELEGSSASNGASAKPPEAAEPASEENKNNGNGQGQPEQVENGNDDSSQSNGSANDNTAEKAAPTETSNGDDTSGESGENGKAEGDANGISEDSSSSTPAAVETSVTAAESEPAADAAPTAQEVPDDASNKGNEVDESLSQDQEPSSSSTSSSPQAQKRPAQEDASAPEEKKMKATTEEKSEKSAESSEEAAANTEAAAITV